MPDNAVGNGAADRPGDSGGGDKLGLGDRLRSARKARALTVECVAEAMHLDESVVTALEQERFDDVGAAVFVRGHLKAYAKIVGLSPEAISEAWQPPVETPAIPPHRPRSRRSIMVNPVVWSFTALVLVLGVFLTAYVMQDDDTSLRVAPAAVESDPPTGLAAAEPEVTPAPDSLTTIVPGAPVPGTPAPMTARVPDSPPGAVQDTESRAAQSAGASVPVAAPPTARPDRLVSLSLDFHEESWVEISDANQRLLFGLQRPGRHRELTGEPPFRLLIGNADGVELRVDDEPYVVPSARVNGKVARFEIDAPE